MLTGLSCVSLGVLLAAVTPPRWLAGGIILMAIADAALVTADLLQRPNNALNAAHPLAGLPQLQSAVLGSAVMGYGDLFIAGALGGLLASEFGLAEQLRGRAAGGGAGDAVRPDVPGHRRAAGDCAGGARAGPGGAQASAKRPTAAAGRAVCSPAAAGAGGSCAPPLVP